MRQPTGWQYLCWTTPGSRQSISGAASKIFAVTISVYPMMVSLPRQKTDIIVVVGRRQNFILFLV